MRSLCAMQTAGNRGPISGVPVLGVMRPAPQERAGVLSLLYVVSYLAMGLPAVIAGVLVVHGGGILPTARAYGLTVMVLAALALLGVIRPRRRLTTSAAQS